MCCAWFAWSSHLFVAGHQTQTGKVNFKVRKCQTVCEPLVLICFIHFFFAAFQNMTAVQFLLRGRASSYPDDGLLCCVLALWPLCLLHYISKSHQLTCAVMTASIKGTTSCESMMRVSMWHLCTINLTTPSQPITQRRPLCLLAFGGVLCRRRFAPQRPCKAITPQHRLIFNFPSHWAGSQSERDGAGGQLRL